MVRFVCDTCSAVKEADETWILGLAAESVGVRAARREVTIVSGWDRERAVDPLAVHFCSLQCKTNYMERFFGDHTADEEILVQRGVPETVIARRILDKQVVTKTSRTRGKKNAA